MPPHAPLGPPATAALLLLGLAACAPATGTPQQDPGPYVFVLGTAQDAGLPQIAARHPLDEAARRDPSRRRLVSSILIVDPRGGADAGRRWLIDASPDLPEQIELARNHPANRPEPAGRPPLFEGIFLTHAHMGHIAGLLELGREAYAAEGQVVHGSKSMRTFLQQDRPWSLLVEQGHVRLAELANERPIELAPDLILTPLRVPHRAEITDTYGFRIDGPNRSVLFIPDIDKWGLWQRDLVAELRDVDIALLDGSFFGDGEIPGRAMSEIPHPFIVETLERLAAADPPLDVELIFTHLNHTNAAAAPGTPEREQVEATGARIADRGQVLQL